MAGTAVKKLKQANEQFLQIILIGIAASSAISLLLGIFFVFYSYFGILNWIGWVLCVGLMFACYYLLKRSAKCEYEGSRLVSAGEDLKTGLLSYLFDIICMIAFVQNLACFTNWAWLIFLIVRYHEKKDTTCSSTKIM